jgi:hypothetical protein
LHDGGRCLHGDQYGRDSTGAGTAHHQRRRHNRPYQSLGLIQATRKGVLLFGFIDVVGTDLQYGFNEVLTPLVRQMGGDAAINVRFHQTQYLPITKVLFVIPFFFIPLPTEFTVTAEVIRFTDGGAGWAPNQASPPAQPPSVQ